MLASDNHMSPPYLPKLPPSNLANSPTKIKNVGDQWVTLLIMEDDECSLIYAKMTNSNIIKVATKLTCTTTHPLNQDKYIVY